MLNRKFSFINLFSTEEISFTYLKKKIYIPSMKRPGLCTLFTNLKIEKVQPLKVINKPEKVCVFFYYY